MTLLAVACSLLGGAWSLVPAMMAYSVRADSFGSLAAVPPRPVAIVFGAGVTGKGRLTDVLRKRVDASIDLYRAGKVRMLLMSGDDAGPYYNEPAAMRRYALRLGVPSSAIACDYGGLRTYQTCLRARDRFHIAGAVLVTQAFHLPRALFTARSLGIDAVGYDADNPLTLCATLRLAARENCAALEALADLTSSRISPRVSQ